MYLWYENRLFNLTFIFHDKQIYEDKKDKFKKWTSENIREFLKIKSIFYTYTIKRNREEKHYFFTVLFSWNIN